MKKANISYLRNHLSEVIAGVREGDSVVILGPGHAGGPIGALPECPGRWIRSLG
jgi:antitoxin (DNA-binding transcriptional repressor) of toxin-antitoxin stability system